MNFGELYDDHRSRLLNSLTGMVRDRETAEDIAATVFAKAAAKLHTFRPPDLVRGGLVRVGR